MENQKIKILYLITKSNFGGAQRYVYDLAVSMKKQKKDVCVCAGGNGLLFKKLNQEEIRTISIPFLNRDINILNDIKTFFFLLNLYKKENPSVIHTNSSKIGLLGNIAGFIFLLGKKIKGQKKPKIIFTIHGWAFNESRNFITKKILKIMYWITIVLSTKTIAVSRQTKEQILNLPFMNKKISVIHNGISNIDFYEREESRDFFSNKITKNINQNDFIIGTIAELHPIKGLIYAIRACSILKKSGFSFLYIIMGTGDQKKYLENEIIKNDLENNVFMLGYIEDASKYLLGFDMFLLPSLSEGLPYVLLEAKMANIPIVATNVGGISEIIEDGIPGILITPKNPHSISEAIKKITSNKYTYEKNLKEKVTNNFSLEKMANETSALYM